DVEVAFGQLDAYRGQDADAEEGQHHQHQGGELRQQRYAVGHRHRVDHLAQLHAAFAPDQLAGIEHHDDVQQPAVGAFQYLQHQRGDRARRSPVHAADVDAAADEVEHAEQQHDQ